MLFLVTAGLTPAQHCSQRNQHTIPSQQVRTPYLLKSGVLAVLHRFLKLDDWVMPTSMAWQHSFFTQYRELICAHWMLDAAVQ